MAAAQAPHALADAVRDAAAHDVEAIEHRAVHLTFESAVISRNLARTGLMWRSRGDFRP